jgi:hypothetical protein
MATAAMATVVRARVAASSGADSVRCRGCGEQRLVACACKRRGLCPVVCGAADDGRLTVIEWSFSACRHHRLRTCSQCGPIPASGSVASCRAWASPAKDRIRRRTRWPGSICCWPRCTGPRCEAAVVRSTRSRSGANAPGSRAAEARRRLGGEPLRLRLRCQPPRRRVCARHDRAWLERLVRYTARPPLVADWLEELADTLDHQPVVR